jgi:hypothetical protein
LWESPVGTLLRRVLGTQIEQLRLKPLVDEDMLALSRFLGSEVLNSEAAKQAGGNPLFLEHYLQTSPPFVPPVVQASVEQAVTNLTTEETALVEVLCLFDRPVEGKVLSQICDESVDQVLATFRRKNRC